MALNVLQYYITLICSISCVIFLVLTIRNDLASGAKPEILSPDLGFSMPFWVSVFFVWRSAVFGK